MKKTLLLSAVLLAGLGSIAFAADSGVGLTWGNHCWSGVSDALDWACDSNDYTGVRMTVSFKTSYTRDDFAGAALYMTSHTEDGGPIPDWWNLSSSGCRPWTSNMTISADASAMVDGMGACVDVWQGTSASCGGGIGEYTVGSGGDRSSFCAVYATPNPIPVTAGVEYFAFQVRFSTNKTVGGECAGCSQPVIWSLHHLEVAFVGLSGCEYLFDEYPGGNATLRWQHESTVPARNSTWGQIKGMYR